VVLQVPVLEVDPDAGTVTYKNERGELVTQSALDGNAKLQWRPDWAMRWAALGVDYEMSGKDLIDSHKVSSRICQILGATPPDGFFYELFLDEQGQKISKSRGNGLSVGEWLTYGPKESLKLFMYQSPKKAKRLYFDVIPRQVDDYSTFLDKFPAQDEAQRIANPVWHMHQRQPPRGGLPITFSMLLNLASVVNAEEPGVLWAFIKRYAPEATPEAMPLLAELVEHALAYYRDFVKPAKAYRLPSEDERRGLKELASFLQNFKIDYGRHAAEVDAAARIQEEVYEIGKRHGFADHLRDWFKALYEILLGQSEGPRFGSFVAFYGPEETRALIDHVLKGEALGKPAA
jgi:lysyl-tRNA synthetase class 1